MTKYIDIGGGYKIKDNYDDLGWLGEYLPIKVGPFLEIRDMEDARGLIDSVRRGRRLTDGAQKKYNKLMRIIEEHINDK